MPNTSTSNSVFVAPAAPPPTPPPPPPPSPPPPYIPPTPPTIGSCGLPGLRFFQSPTWNFLITNLDTSGITILNRIAASKSVTYTLNDATQASLTVPSDNKLVNLLYTDGDPKVGEGVRCLYGFRDEFTGMTCRFAGLIMHAADSVSGDVPKTTITAWDPWRYLDVLPMINVFALEFGDQGVRYIGDLSQQQSQHDILVPGGVAGIIIDQLGSAQTHYSSIFGNNATFIDYGQTAFYTGTLEDVPIRYPHTIQNATSIGQALRDIAAQGLCDIVLTPVWDPINRPGILAELNVHYRAGTTRYDVVFGWDRAPKTLTTIDREEDGTQRANNILFYQSRGGPPVSLKQDTTSQAKWRTYYKNRYFPTQGGHVLDLEDLATAQLVIRTDGVETITVSPTPERSKSPLVDYNIGDTVQISISNNLRKSLLGTYRVMQIPIDISDESLETVQQLTLMKFLPSQYIGPFTGPQVTTVTRRGLSDFQQRSTRRSTNPSLPGPSGGPP